METTLPRPHEVRRTLSHLLPRIETTLAGAIAADPAGWLQFARRLEGHFPDLFTLYLDLYRGRYDFLFHLEDLLCGVARSWFERPNDLRALDDCREQEPLWFQSNQTLGGVIYVDLFAGDLEGVRAKIPYFQELGLTYLHLMPLFKAPEGENDGGYAVSSYHEVNPVLGTMEQLASLARDLRTANISLVVDLVFNHTSAEHNWAERSRAGDPDFQDLYVIYPDRTMPDAYERTLREIFPDEHPGSFSPLEIPNGAGATQTAWVWTTFHTYQWDLNYANPATFNRMAGEMLFLANQGVEVIRLDAVAFIWKQLGTSCENLPGAHTLIRAFNAVARIAAPALLFKSEAIVHPDDVAKYIHPAECQLSYNPLLMALLWNGLATRKVDLLSQALANRFQIHPQTTWVNYIRCHDDIGWTFSDEDAALLGVNGEDHRQFLNEFYRGRFPGSFARGLPFQENPKTGDCRISGTCASLAGLEKAILDEGPAEVALAIRRILLIHGVILTVGGIPLLYLGDEVATLNDYSYRDHPDHARDSRWVHRPKADWVKYERRNNPAAVEGQVFSGLRDLIQFRKTHSVFYGNELEVLQTENEHVLGYIRTHGNQQAVILANFSESKQSIPARVLEELQLGLDRDAGTHGLTLEEDFILAPLELRILTPQPTRQAAAL
jgi:glycosidase